jgi:hypothetical protein
MWQEKIGSNLFSYLVFDVIYTKLSLNLKICFFLLACKLLKSQPICYIYKHWFEILAVHEGKKKDGIVSDSDR